MRYEIFASMSGLGRSQVRAAGGELCQRWTGHLPEFMLHGDNKSNLELLCLSLAMDERIIDLKHTSIVDTKAVPISFFPLYSMVL